MKIWSVFSLLILFHAAIIGLLLVQPGCKSQPSQGPDPSLTQPTAVADSPSEPVETLDPSFNAGMPTSGQTTSRSLSAPTRPSGSYSSGPDTSTLEPVLDPVLDPLSVPTSETTAYVVQKGDTLSGIAREKGVSLSSLLSLNGLSKSSTIYVGQSLLVPGASEAPSPVASTPSASGQSVTVKKGDTLSGIATRAGTTVRALKAVNGLTKDTIFVGQTLYLPENVSVPIATAPAPEPVISPVAANGQQSYTIRPGDTPSGIARRFGITAAELMAANGITDPRKLIVGKTLVIPSAGSAPPVATYTEPVPVATPSAQPSEVVVPLSAEPSEDDPMSMLEALEDEDLPFVEVETVEEDAVQ